MMYEQFIILDLDTGQYHKKGFTFNPTILPSKAKHYNTEGTARGVIKQMIQRSGEMNLTVTQVNCTTD